MSNVRLRHPDLPEDQTITVPEQAAAHHRAAGWQPVEDPKSATSTPDATADAKADSPPPTAPAAADATPDPAPDTTPRRRATKEANQ